MSEVWITGAGGHGPFGDLDDTATALEAGRVAVAPQRLAGLPDFPEFPGAPAADFDIRRYLPQRKLKKYMSRAAELAVLAAGRALAAAGLSDVDGEGAAGARADTALWVATGLIAFELGEVTDIIAASVTDDGDLDLERMGARGLRACHPLLPFKMLLNMPLGLVSIAHGLKGESAALYPGADQGALALESAARSIRAGRIERALVGGCNHGLGMMPLMTWRRSGWLADSVAAAQPGADHRGWAAADGAAFLLLESPRAAAERGAAPIATLGDVAYRRHPDGERTAALRDVWRRVTGATAEAGAEAAAPETVSLGGSLSAADDKSERRLVAELWAESGARVQNLEGALGHQGAAAFLMGCALAARAGRSALVSGAYPEGVAVAASFLPAEGRP